MKTRLYIAAWVFLSFSIFSCSPDDIDEKSEVNGNNLKNEVPKYINQNTYAKVQDTVYAITIPEINNETEGDPIIIKPPRKD